MIRHGSPPRVSVGKFTLRHYFLFPQPNSSLGARHSQSLRRWCRCRPANEFKFFETHPLQNTSWNLDDLRSYWTCFHGTESACEICPIYIRKNGQQRKARLISAQYTWNNAYAWPCTSRLSSAKKRTSPPKTETTIFHEETTYPKCRSQRWGIILIHHCCLRLP